MAKNALQMPKAGGGGLKKVVGLFIGIAIAVLVVQHPTEAADWTKGVFGVAENIIDGLVIFFKGVAQ